MVIADMGRTFWELLAMVLWDWIWGLERKLTVFNTRIRLRMETMADRRCSCDRLPS
jgi:hypothetical protein